MVSPVRVLSEFSSCSWAILPIFFCILRHSSQWVILFREAFFFLRVDVLVRFLSDDWSNNESWARTWASLYLNHEFMICDRKFAFYNLLSRFFNCSSVRNFGMEVVSIEGLRSDGRRPHELRRVYAKIHNLPEATGSSYFECGNTKLLVAVNGPRGVSSLIFWNRNSLKRCSC